MRQTQISIIAAFGKGRVIGKDNQLLWHIPDDLKRFKKLTRNHPIIMGRKTFESIGRVLPERINIVVTRDPSWQYDGTIIAHNLEEAIKWAQDLDEQEIFIIGGGEIYGQALPLADKLYLTLIDDEKEGDVHLPAYEKDFTKKTFEETREWNGLKYQWVNLERI